MEKVICQSCAMPMQKEGDFGTKTDGSACNMYCCYCYQKGSFTSNVTMEEMIEKLVSMHDEMNMKEGEARDLATKVLPTLKRWKKKSSCGCCKK